jgi:hypothetical protein
MIDFTDEKFARIEDEVRIYNEGKLKEFMLLVREAASENKYEGCDESWDFVEEYVEWLQFA